MCVFSRNSFAPAASAVGHHEDGQRAVLFSQLANEFGAAHGSHAVVGDEQVGGDAVNMVQRVSGLNVGGDVQVGDCAGEDALDEEKLVRVIVGDCDVQALMHLLRRSPRLRPANMGREPPNLLCEKRCLDGGRVRRFAFVPNQPGHIGCWQYE